MRKKYDKEKDFSQKKDKDSLREYLWNSKLYGTIYIIYKEEN